MRSGSFGAHIEGGGGGGPGAGLVAFLRIACAMLAPLRAALFSLFFSPFRVDYLPGKHTVKPHPNASALFHSVASYSAQPIPPFFYEHYYN